MTDLSRPRVSIITVNYHTEAEVLRLLASVRAHRPFRDAVFILVDNSPGHGVAFPLDSWDLYLPQESNRGFGPACNIGALASDAMFLFFANPDLEFTGPLDGLAEAIRGAVVAACPLIDPPGYFQNRRLPTVGRLAWDFLGMPQLFPGNAISNRYYYQPPPSVPFEVEQPAAAALLFDRGRFLDLGGFDPAFVPAWFEDVDLFARAKRREWKALCDPGFRVRHRSGTTAEQLGRHRFFEFYGQNGVRYFRKHHSRAAVAGVKGILSCGLLLRFLRGRVSLRLALKAWLW